MSSLLIVLVVVMVAFVLVVLGILLGLVDTVKKLGNHYKRRPGATFGLPACPGLLRLEAPKTASGDPWRPKTVSRHT